MYIVPIDAGGYIFLSACRDRPSSGRTNRGPLRTTQMSEMVECVTRRFWLSDIQVRAVLGAFAKEVQKLQKRYFFPPYIDVCISFRSPIVLRRQTLEVHFAANLKARGDGGAE